MEKKDIQQIIDYIKSEAILSPQPADWGQSLTKDQCFNDGVNEVIYRLEKLLNKI